MIKLTFISAAALVAMSVSAMAASQSQIWNVTEEGTSGIKSAQGQWAVNMDDNKISGTANMQADNGNMLTYTFDGSKNGADYSVTMAKRSDDKNGCVWTGHSPASTDAKSHGLIGQVHCDGNRAFTIRAGF
jgi:hypothetical protein